MVPQLVPVAKLTAADRAERARRVAGVALAVAAGSYRVPAGDVAEAILAFHQREEEQ